MRATVTFAAAAIMLSLSAPSLGQTTKTSPKDVLGSILGTLFGDRAGTNTTLESQWSLGRTPLLNQQGEFDLRVQNEVRLGNLTTTTGSRLTSDYSALVQLEARYAADGRITTQERTACLTNTLLSLRSSQIAGMAMQKPPTRTWQMAGQNSTDGLMGRLRRGALPGPRVPG